MLERLTPVLKVLCAALAALVLFQVVRLVVRSDPLAHLNIPALPTLPPDTNAPAGPGTNSPAVPGSAKAGTNTDRKSTRLNSSHLGISYAVFCLKKKTKT